MEDEILGKDRDALIEAGLPLVKTIAGEYETPGFPLDDLFQVGCVGLIKAIDRDTDPAPLVRKEIEAYIRR
ncbi:MAG: hypothetical protein IKM31_05925 [Oscillospiraceae bacterium]|nr:hypothetical protein [Oscillospiraceae bacterium]